METLTTLCLNALFIFGLQFAFQNGNVLGFIPTWWTNTKWQFAIKLGKPLFFCAPCMSSAWGWVGFQAVVIEPIPWLYYPIWVIALAGLNSIISKAIN